MIDIAEKIKQIKKKDTEFSLEQMAEAGLHFGHRTSRINPKMKPYIYGVRNSVHLIDLEKTAEKLKEALKFIAEVVSQNKTLLVVGTKIQIKSLVRSLAEECNLPYVNERWLGGTFTNFDVLRKRIDYFKDLERQKETGELEKYTKKERIKINREIANLDTKFRGLKSLDRLPDAILVMDIKKDHLAIKEAHLKKIKIVAIADTNVDPTSVDYAIPANDDAMSSVKYILDIVKETILKNKPKIEK